MTALLSEHSVTSLDVVHHTDALSLLLGLRSASVDLIVTDPPYGIGYASSWTTRMDGSPRVASASFGADEFNASWVPEAARVLKPGGALYLFTRWDVAANWKAAIEGAGLTGVQRIVWDKQHWGMGDLRYYGSQVEDILFCVKGEHVLKWPGRCGNLWSVNGRIAKIAKDGHYDNPTQKPEALMRKIILLSSDAGDVVLDPFCGSGTTPRAAQTTGRRFIAGDISAYQVSIARARVAQAYTLPLFAAQEAA